MSAQYPNDDATATLRAPLGFASAARVVADTERPTLLRALTTSEVNGTSQLEFHDCALRDWSAPGAPPLGLPRMGFDAIDLAPLPGLQAVLARVRDAGEITRADAGAIRGALRGRTFRLSSGHVLRLLVVAREGLIMRTAGPNGLRPDPDVPMGEMNGHDAANAVHADQDVRGTPLRQLMRGLAPRLFRHRTPDGGNRASPLMLVNLWVPLTQVTRPLVLMDRDSLDARRHQLRYALPTEDFLERGEATRVNDIWAILHDSAQRWYFHPDLDARRAYVFDTLGTPHGATVLPGEAEAERCYRALCAACAAVAAGDHAALLAATSVPDTVDTAIGTLPLRRAIDAMRELLREAHACAQAGAAPSADWQLRAQAALQRVVRKSIEMRVVALLLPDRWPFNRGVGGDVAAGRQAP